MQSQLLPAGGENHRLGAKNFEPAALAIVGKCADDTLAILEQRHNANLHVNLDALMDTVILQRPNHFQAGAVSDVRQPRIFVAAKVSLQNASVLRAIEDRTPRFEFAHAIRRLLGVQFRHAPLIHILAAAHRVGEVDFPTVTIIDVGQRGGDPSFGHDRVRFA